jgi:PAS domain S-box-containing protein
VIASDLASDTQWDRYGWRTAALTHGLKACWSTTILASNGPVLGTFAIYWRQPGSPSEQDQKIIEQVTHLAAIAIERKRDEAVLRESEERFRLIVDTIPGLVWTMNASGEVESANQQTLGYFGKTLDELKEWALVLHPDDRTRVLEYWRLTIESGQPYELEHRILGADGVYRWFHARDRPQRDTEGRIVRWYNLLTDINDRKRAEGELEKAFDEKARSEAELRTVIDAIPQLIVALAADGNFLSANQALLEYTGLTREEAASGSLRKIFHPEDSERLRNERGAIIRWYATGTDIDNRKQAEERTQQENLALREQIDQVFYV